MDYGLNCHNFSNVFYVLMYNTEKKMRTDILIVNEKSKVIELKVNWNIHRVIDCSLSNPSERSCTDC